jgi:hypothetical protein
MSTRRLLIRLAASLFGLCTVLGAEGGSVAPALAGAVVCHATL